MEHLIYKILTRSELKTARGDGWFRGSAVDLADGFIHFSTGTQVRETASRHFSGARDLILLEIDSRNLPQDQLEWELSRGGALFPHLYGPLDLDAVSRQYDLPLGPDGRHIFPAELILP